LPITIPVKKKASSNKSETLSKKSTTITITKPKKASSANHHPAPFIDKISIVVNPSENVGHDMYMSFFETLEDHTMFVPTPKQKVNGYTYGRRINLQSVIDFKKRPLLQLKHDKELQQITQFRLEFVPVDLGRDGMDELNLALGELAEDCWQYVLKQGRITRIDIAVDLADLAMNAFLYLPVQKTSVSHWKTNGKLETSIFGQKKGKQLIIYDRGAKRKANGQSALGKTGVRIEHRLTKVNYKVSEIALIPNPFQKMVLSKRLPAVPPDRAPKESDWLQFCDSVQVRGLDNALALIPPQRRTVYRDHVKSEAAAWWQPDLIWKQWQPMLSSLGFVSS
jgi:hypothetical protein